MPSRTIRGRLGGMQERRASKPLKPMPPSLSRPVPPQGSMTARFASEIKGRTLPTYSDFEPFYLPGKNKRHLQEGIEPRYPAAILVDHDVSAVDWDRFLVNIRVAGALV